MAPSGPNHVRLGRTSEFGPMGQGQGSELPKGAVSGSSEPVVRALLASWDLLGPSRKVRFESLSKRALSRPSSGPSGGPLGALLGTSRGVLALSWRPPGTSCWGPSEKLVLKAIQNEPCRGPLGAFWGPSWSPLGAVSGPPGASWGLSGTSRGPPETLVVLNAFQNELWCGSLGAFWGLSWSPLGALSGPPPRAFLPPRQTPSDGVWRDAC